MATLYAQGNINWNAASWYDASSGGTGGLSIAVGDTYYVQTGNTVTINVNADLSLYTRGDSGGNIGTLNLASTKVVAINPSGNTINGNLGGIIGWNFGVVVNNAGTIGANDGSITTNNTGTVRINYGTITTNNANGFVQNHNSGTFTTNNGVVLNNNGTIITNGTTGIVMVQSGTITTNNGFAFTALVSLLAEMTALPTGVAIANLAAFTAKVGLTAAKLQAGNTVLAIVGTLNPAATIGCRFIRGGLAA